MVVYDACRLGAFNCEYETTIDRKYAFAPNQEMADILIGLVRSVYNGPMPFEAAPTVPAKVFMTAYRQRVNGAQQALVHLLNATGSRMEAGQTVPRRNREDAWPQLAEDIRFDITLPNFTAAYVVSPEFEGRRPLYVLPLGGNRFRITVSKADLAWFSTVRFELQP